MLGFDPDRALVKAGLIRESEARLRPGDGEKTILPNGGSVAWNAYWRNG